MYCKQFYLIQQLTSDHASHTIQVHIWLCHARTTSTVYEYALTASTGHAYAFWLPRGGPLRCMVPNRKQSRHLYRSTARLQVHIFTSESVLWSYKPLELRQSLHAVCTARMAFKDLDVEGLYKVLEKELGSDIATVIRDKHLSGEDFLSLTEADVSSMFSELGQRKKILQLIAAKAALTAEVNTNFLQGRLLPECMVCCIATL